MKQIHSKAFGLGSKAMLLHLFAHTDGTTIEFKFSLTNDHYDIVVHNVATVKDNKLFRAEPIQDTKTILLANFEAYFAAFDGTAKDFSSVGHLFDQVYHDGFAYKVDEEPIYYDKNQMKQVQSNLLAFGSKATLLMFKDVGSDQVEFKFCMVNDKVDVVVHNIATVKDNKLIKSKPVDSNSLESVSKLCEVNELYNAEKKSAPGVECGEEAFIAAQ